MPTSDRKNFEVGQTRSGKNSFSRNGTTGFDTLPSSEPVLARAMSRRLAISKSLNSMDGGLILSEGSGRCFSLDEVQKATNNFDDALVIGTGGFGKVYKGFIHDIPTMVAIKRLNAKSKQGAKEFLTEVNMLSKLQHSNLVTLIGYCNECQELILVYEYVARGNLASHLYKLSTTKSNRSIPPLSWEQRLDICIGAARGLNHLHRGTNQSFIHRDVKTSNILIDENWRAKISDFGLMEGTTSHSTTHISTKVKDFGLMRRTKSHSITHVSTEVKGTFGYLDPDYFITKRPTTKSDVYAFGVVLLEVLCARPAVDRNLSEGEMNLAQWVQRCIKEGNLARVIDPSLNGQIAPRCLKSFVLLATNCLQHSPKSRPTMAEVLARLELALISQQRGRTEGIMTKMFQGLMDWWLKEMKNSSSEQLKDLLSTSEDPEIHFKYIKAAAKMGQIEEVERITRESNFYDPEKIKHFLMKAKLRDARPLINVCDRFGFVPDLTHYLYSNNMLSYIEVYVQKVNPGNAPLVVGQLLDDKCPEDFIKGLILPVRSLLTIEPLVEVFEIRNRLPLLTEFLQHLVNEGSQDIHVHNALREIVIDSNRNPEQSLDTNQYMEAFATNKKLNSNKDASTKNTHTSTYTNLPRKTYANTPTNNTMVPTYTVLEIICVTGHYFNSLGEFFPLNFLC